MAAQAVNSSAATRDKAAQPVTKHFPKRDQGVRDALAEAVRATQLHDRIQPSYTYHQN